MTANPRRDAVVLEYGFLGGEVGASLAFGYLAGRLGLNAVFLLAGVSSALAVAFLLVGGRSHEKSSTERTER